MEQKNLKTVLLTAGTILAVIIGLQAQPQHDQFFHDADLFFKKYIENGKVDYSAIQQQPGELNDLVQYLNQNGELETGTARGKALLINAYNLFVIQGVVRNYPTESPLSVPGFFDNHDYTIDGKKLSLNKLEKEVLIGRTQDARLHFALVCAALGCPKIPEFAFRPENLEQQLTERTRQALNDPYFIRVDKSSSTVGISQIFSWYKKDFTREGKSVLEYVNEFRNDKIPSEYKSSFYDYDWTLNEADSSGAGKKEEVLDDGQGSNLLRFTPSQLFGKGQFEVNFFNNLYSQTSVRDASGNEISSGIRQSILTSNLQFTIGVSEKRRFNIGADIVFSAGSVGPEEGSSQFQLLGGNVFARDFAVTSLGPRIKWQPFKRLPYFSIQNTVLIPVSSDPEGQSERDVFLALNRYEFRNQFFLDLKLNEKFRLFYEFDVNYFARRNLEEVFYQPNFVDLPSTLFINYFPNPKWNLFVMGQYSPRLGNTALADDPNSQFGLLQWFTQLGGGVKYQVTDMVGLELSYGNFVASQGRQGIEAGAGQVVNLGVRIISF